MPSATSSLGYLNPPIVEFGRPAASITEHLELKVGWVTKESQTVLEKLFSV